MMLEMARMKERIESIELERHNLETIFLQLIERVDMPEPKERRRFVRIPHALPAQMRLSRSGAGSKTYHGTTRNISTGGACLELKTDMFLEEAFEKKEEYEAEVTLAMPEDTKPFYSRSRLVWHARKRGTAETSIGVEFLETDEETMASLTRYVKNQYLHKFKQ